MQTLKMCCPQITTLIWENLGYSLPPNRYAVQACFDVGFLLDASEKGDGSCLGASKHYL